MRSPKGMTGRDTRAPRCDGVGLPGTVPRKGGGAQGGERGVHHMIGGGRLAPPRAGLYPLPRGNADPRMKIAAIDLGSNSFHLIIAETGASGGPQPATGGRARVRLGPATSPRARLPAAAMRRALDV